MMATTATALGPIRQEDVVRVHEAVDAAAADAFRLERQEFNADGPPPIFSREQFWYVLVGCLLTTQQRSTRGSAVDRFLSLDPFPLSFTACEQATNIEELVEREIKKFGGIRRGPTIGREVAANWQRLKTGEWANAEVTFKLLLQQRRRAPIPEDKNAERVAATWADAAFVGFGPKQARNLWQWLGLTRYETPLDSRVLRWINANLSVSMSASQLLNSTGYETAMDYVQALCKAADVLPCIFDAAAFQYDDNQPSRTARKNKSTMVPGFVNVHGQVVIRNTGAPGTDHLQIYQLGCSRCGCVYGANGTDIHERRCPKCDGGKPGLRM